VVGERVDQRSRGVLDLDYEPMVRAVGHALCSIETLRLLVGQKVEHTPYLVALARDNVCDTSLTWTDRKVETKLEVRKHPDSGLTGLHSPPSDKGARVEIASIREIPERAHSGVFHVNRLLDLLPQAEDGRLSLPVWCRQGGRVQRIPGS
jgi:hypothetical protein